MDTLRLSNEALSPPPSVIELDMNPGAWDMHVEELITSGTHVIALRGAGKANGIAPESVTPVVGQLSRHIEAIRGRGTPLKIMYDGDEDRPHLPDIGHIFGRLADIYSSQGVSFVACQTHNRYTRQAPGGGPLVSAAGTPYETFIFNSDLPTGHARLTQSDDLVRYRGYEQVIVGQTGPAVSNQLTDLNNKAASRSEGPVPVAVIDVAGDPAIDEDIARQLSDPGLDGPTRTKLEKRAIQRQEHPKGFLFDSQGNFVIKKTRVSVYCFYRYC
jgi:hypothetical protein